MSVDTRSEPEHLVPVYPEEGRNVPIVKTVALVPYKLDELFLRADSKALGTGYWPLWISEDLSPTARRLTLRP